MTSLPHAGSAPRTIRVTAALIGLMLVLASLVATTGDAAAQPTQADLERAETRLRALEADFDLAVDEYNAAQVRLDELTAEISAATAEVETAEDGMAGSRAVAAQVARKLYTGGASAQVETLLAAGDIDEAQQRFAYLAATRQAQDATFERLAADRRELEADLARLDSARTEADDTRARLAQLQEGIEQRLASQRGDIERLQAEIAAAEQARRAREEAARRERERREAAASRARAEAAATEDEGAAAAAEPASATTTAAETSDEAPQPAQPAATTAPDPAPQAPAAVPVSAGASGAVQWALAQVGKPYQWGGTGPNGFDCSGLTSSAWAAAGVSIPRTSRAQFSGLPRVSGSDLQPGDLLFFGSPVHHVGMYIGGGQMVHAPSSGKTVSVVSSSRSDFAGAARPR